MATSFQFMIEVRRLDPPVASSYLSTGGSRCKLDYVTSEGTESLACNTGIDQ